MRSDDSDRPSGRSAYRRYLFAAGIAAAAVLAYVLRGVLIPLFFAFLLAYALDPIVDKLEAWRIPRPAGAILVMLALISSIFLVAFISIPILVDEFLEVSSRLPEQLNSLHGRAEAAMYQRWHYHLPASWGELSTKYGETLRDSIPTAASIVGALFGTVSAIFVVLGFLIVPVFALYLLIDFNRLVARIATLIPRRWAPDAQRLAGEVHTTLGRYVRGQLIANIVLATLYAGGLRLVGLRLGIPIGIMTGCLSFVPYVGLGTGTLLALIMSLLDWHGGGQVAAVVVVMGTVGILDAMVITPRIVGGSVGLKPIEVLLTMMTAATLFGFLGVILAVPLGAVLKILSGHVVEAYLDSTFYLEPPTHRFIPSIRPPPPAPLPDVDLEPVSTRPATGAE